MIMHYFQTPFLYPQFRNVVSEVLKKKVTGTCDGDEEATNFMQVIQENVSYDVTSYSKC